MSNNNFSDLNFGLTVGGFLKGRLLMEKKTCHRLIFLALTLPKDEGFFSSIRSFRMLTFLAFEISTVKVQSGSLPKIKQLSERGGAETGDTAVWTSFRGIKCYSKKKIVMYLAPLQ
jgi:hypothetical protein